MDWPKVIANLRVKADDPAVTPQESKLLRDKADELAVKYNVTEMSKPPPKPAVVRFTGNTTAQNDLLNKKVKWKDRYNLDDIIEEGFLYDTGYDYDYYK